MVPNTHDQNTLCVMELPSTCTDEELQFLFEQFGPIQSRFVARSESSSTAVVTLLRGSAAMAMWQLNGSLFMGKALR